MESKTRKATLATVMTQAREEEGREVVDARVHKLQTDPNSNKFNSWNRKTSHAYSERRCEPQISNRPENLEKCPNGGGNYTYYILGSKN